MKRALGLPVLLVLLSAGCRSIPFEPTPKVDLTGRDPWQIRRQFACDVPDSYRQVNSVVFEFWWKRFTGLGYLRVDPTDDKFALACMTPLGLTLFKIVAEGDKIQFLTSVEELRERSIMAEAIAGDLRCACLGLIPAEDAHVDLRKYDISFSSSVGGGRLVHTFAGPDAALAEKRLYQGGRLRRRVAYYNYKRIADKLYPHGIVLWNRQYGYRLIIRVKEIRPQLTGQGTHE